MEFEPNPNLNNPNLALGQCIFTSPQENHHTRVSSIASRPSEADAMPLRARPARQELCSWGLQQVLVDRCIGMGHLRTISCTESKLSSCPVLTELHKANNPRPQGSAQVPLPLVARGESNTPTLRRMQSPVSSNNTSEHPSHGTRTHCHVPTIILHG